MKTNSKRILNLILTITLLLSAVFVVGAAPSEAESIIAAITYVDDDGCPQTGSGTENDPYCTIQTAVDNAASESEIHVAEGVYTGVHTITATNSYTYTQVVFIDKTLTLRGGFDAGNWSAPHDPLNQKSVIDAERSGRGITAFGSGTEAVTIDGFTITGGDYTGLGSPDGVHTPVCRRTGFDCGGGLFAYNVELDLLNSYVFDNFGSTPDSGRNSDGGGIYFYDTRFGSSITNTTVISNTVSGQHGEGGGMEIVAGKDVTITDTVFKNNTASDQGGGLVIDGPDLTVTISSTKFYHNKAKNNGGAIKASISAGDTALRMDRIWMVDNQANIDGTSLYLRRVGSEGEVEAEFTNIVFAGSHSWSDNAAANVVYILQWGPLEVTLNHVTAAGNPAGTFLAAQTDNDLGDELEIVLNNALLESFTNGFVAREVPDGELTIRHTNTLFDNVTNQEVTAQGTPTFISTDPITGTAKLDSSYHLTFGSDAIGAGVDAGVLEDIDGDTRSVLHPDIGADEYYPRIYTPLIFRAVQ